MNPKQNLFSEVTGFWPEQKKAEYLLDNSMANSMSEYKAEKNIKFKFYFLKSYARSNIENHNFTAHEIISVLSALEVYIKKQDLDSAAKCYMEI